VGAPEPENGASAPEEGLTRHPFQGFRLISHCCSRAFGRAKDLPHHEVAAEIENVQMLAMEWEKGFPFGPWLLGDRAFSIRAADRTWKTVVTVDKPYALEDERYPNMRHPIPCFLCRWKRWCSPEGALPCDYRGGLLTDQLDAT
jgi:hypothetical protein